MKRIISIIVALALLSIAIFFALTIKKEVAWRTFEDTRYHYTLSYPERLIATEKKRESVSLSDTLGGGERIVSGGVRITQEDGYGVINIDILEESGISTVLEWLKHEKTLFPNHRPIIEEYMLIDGHYAIITHEESDDEEENAYTHEKKTIFIRNGIVFEITTRFPEAEDEYHVRVLESMHFTDSPVSQAGSTLTPQQEIISKPFVRNTTFSREEHNFTFRYPSDFQLMEEETKHTYDDGTKWQYLFFKSPLRENNARFSISINPDGIGIPYDKSFSVHEALGEKVVSLDAECTDDPNCTDDGTMLFLTRRWEEKGNAYQILFAYEELENSDDTTNYETIFKDIVRSFRAY